MAVQVDFTQWGVIALAPGQEEWRWFTWNFDGDHWSRMSIVPTAWSPANGSIQIVEEWAKNNTLWVHLRNNGSDYVYYQPTAVTAPSR
ncbi:hypothetical protein [Amycolatopsis regifaucium]|uniref:Uncharacterized protein n=1 Tax=Amycolatopsis regifaucium TaxID=546365 RepID=A0A154MX42_9PSEU|nr:hypothetical protein [Amycolatopsis regifaucium]KZB88029.1 hypothetical protein AVL48_18815 [Amycolatopsis regifaucium]OKA04469.1 hypothetical protein ATP06_0231690 [Amycolatopsis regifaucium]SFH49679.1 hypothetical protein SAMN04489731_104481 [Amycolatopsis regifaucium]